MATFLVSALMHATHVEEVEADTAEEAAEKACSESVCHQCSRKVELGDHYATIVSDENGDTVYDDSVPALDCATDEQLAAEVNRRKMAKANSGAPLVPAPVFTEAEVIAAMEAVQKAARVAVLNSGTEGPAGAINLIDLRAILNRIRGGR